MLVLATLAGCELSALGLSLVLLAHLIKEYIMGFPELILDPPEPSKDSTPDHDRTTSGFSAHLTCCCGA